MSLRKETSAVRRTPLRGRRMLFLIMSVLFATLAPFMERVPEAHAIDSRCFYNPVFIIGNPGECSVISDKNPYCQDGGKCGVQAGIDKTKAGLSGIATTTSIRRLVLGWLDFILQYAVFFSVIILVGAGLYLIFSVGNEGVFKKVLKIVTYIIVGFVIILLSYALVNTLLRVLD